MIASLKGDEELKSKESVIVISDIELKVGLSLRGLKITGLKKVLQDRLQEAYATEHPLINGIFQGECAVVLEGMTFQPQSSSPNKAIAIRMPEEISSYEELKDFTSNLIESVGCCKSLKGTRPDEYVYFRTLFLQHPHAVRKKVALISDISFPVVCKQTRDSMFVDYRIAITTSDGKKDGISWIKSIRKRMVDENLKIQSAIQYMRTMKLIV